MKKTYTIWTPERIDALNRRYAQADSLAALAKELGCTELAIYQKANYLGLKRRTATFRPTKYTTEQFEFVRKHYPNLSNKTISVVSGVSIGAIRKWRYKFSWLKSERYKQECKEYTASHSHPSERRRALQREYRRRYRERHPDRVLESQRKYKEKKHSLAEIGSGPERDTEREE